MQIRTRGIAALLSLGLLGAACHSGGTRTQSPAAAPASTPYGGPAAAPAARPSAPTAPMALQSGGSNLDSALATARSTGKPVVLLLDRKSVV